MKVDSPSSLPQGLRGSGEMHPLPPGPSPGGCQVSTPHPGGLGHCNHGLHLTSSRCGSDPPGPRHRPRPQRLPRRTSVGQRTRAPWCRRREDKCTNQPFQRCSLSPPHQPFPSLPPGGVRKDKSQDRFPRPFV